MHWNGLEFTRNQKTPQTKSDGISMDTPSCARWIFQNNNDPIFSIYLSWALNKQLTPENKQPRWPS